MILAADRRILLDASDRKLLGLFLGAEPPSTIDIDTLRAIAEAVLANPPQHVYADVLLAVLKDLLAEAEALFEARMVH